MTILFDKMIVIWPVSDYDVLTLLYYQRLSGSKLGIALVDLVSRVRSSFVVRGPWTAVRASIGQS